MSSSIGTEEGTDVFLSTWTRTGRLKLNGAGGDERFKVFWKQCVGNQARSRSAKGCSQCSQRRQHSQHSQHSGGGWWAAEPLLSETECIRCRGRRRQAPEYVTPTLGRNANSKNADGDPIERQETRCWKRRFPARGASHMENWADGNDHVAARSELLSQHELHPVADSQQLQAASFVAGLRYRCPVPRALCPPPHVHRNLAPRLQSPSPSSCSVTQDRRGMTGVSGEPGELQRPAHGSSLLAYEPHMSLLASILHPPAASRQTSNLLQAPGPPAQKDPC
jgi:hypothetical protein